MPAPKQQNKHATAKAKKTTEQPKQQIRPRNNTNIITAGARISPFETLHKMNPEVGNYYSIYWAHIRVMMQSNMETIRFIFDEKQRLCTLVSLP